MHEITENRTGAVDITGPTTLSGNVEGVVTVEEGAELRLTGEVTGDVVVKHRGALVLIGQVKGAVRNEGGAVDIFGFVGRVEDLGETETYVSRGAIIGGKRASRPGKLSSLDI